MPRDTKIDGTRHVVLSRSSGFVTTDVFSGEIKRYMSLRLLGLLSLESQSFLSKLFLDNLHREIFSRVKNSSLSQLMEITFLCN